MVESYRRSNWRGDFSEYVELRQIDELLAVFHVAPSFNMGLVYNPATDLEVGLTEDDLKERIKKKRETADLEVDEEKKATLDFESYWQDTRRKGTN